MGLMFSAIGGFYTLWRLRQREERIDKKDGEGLVESKKIKRFVGVYNDLVRAFD